MGQIWVREFLGGLDARRLPETTSGGVLIEATDGHITRGGEFEQRASFVKAFELPAGTIGLAYGRSNLFVFGSTAEPAGMPANVRYQQLAHPTSESATLVDVPSFDLYGGKIYAVAVFSDGTIAHYYDGVLIEDWYDGRARAAFSVIGGGATAAIAATGSLDITGGTSGGGNEIASVTVDGVTITSGAVAHTGSNASTATALAANINGHTSSPNYTAVANGTTVTITAVTAGAATNGFVVAATVGGDATVGNEVDMAGGADATASTLADLTINGVSVIADPVDWAGSNDNMAGLIAVEINTATSEPEYTAIAVGATVIITANEPGTAENGKVVAFTLEGGLTVDPSEGLSLSGGADPQVADEDEEEEEEEAEETFQPGLFVKTIDAKINALSGSNWHFSGIAEPTKFTTDATGAGFVDLSTYSSGSEMLQAIATYQDQVAIFSETNIQIWFTDPDPTLNRKTQLLFNTGTIAPHSVTQFGDSDLFYLDASGLRSVRARSASTAAATTDIGSSIDPLIIEAIEELDGDFSQVFGLIEPRDGRFWLIMKDQIFVFTYFVGSKVSAWSRYTTIDEDGVAFEVDKAVVFQRRVYLRSGDSIYVYGGLGNTLTYDATEAIARTPYLDAEKPTQSKNFTGLDAAARGEWVVYAAYDPNNNDAQDKIGTIVDTTFDKERFPALGNSTHVSLIFKSKGVGPHKIGSCVVHHDLDADED